MNFLIPLAALWVCEDEASLGSYGAQEFYTIHVVDLNPSASALGSLPNEDEVEKYEISEQDYNKRDDTFRAFKKKMMAQNPNFMKQNQEAEEDKINDDFQKEEAEAISTGS